MPEIADYDKSGYDYTKYWIGRQYEDIAEKAVLRSLLPQQGQHILDVGGGFGRLLKIYTPRFKQVTILDYSQNNLQHAREFAQEIGFSHLNTVQGDAYSLPFNESTFDTVVMVRVLHHLNNPKQVFQEIYRVLKPNGWLILEMANKINLRASLRAWRNQNWQFRQQTEPVHHQVNHTNGIFLNYHPQSIREMLTSVGFNILHQTSSSNLRLNILKQLLPLPVLLSLDQLIAPLFSRFDLGPSLCFQCRRP